MIDHAVFRMMDVAANHSFTLAAAGEIHQHVFKVGNIRHGRFHFLLDGLREREVRFTFFHPVAVVLTVEPQQQRIAHVAEFGQPFHLGGHLVEHIAVRHEIMLAVAFQYIIFRDGQIGKLQRGKVVQKVIMVSADVNDFRTMLFHHLHDNFEEMRMCRLPFADTRFLQVPSVDDVTVQNQPSAIDSAQKIADLIHL